MYLEKNAIDFFRRYDFSLPLFSNRHGNNPTRVIGRNLEFEQYHPYFPGENIKDIDWKIFARSDKIFIKEYGSDLNSKVRVVIDNSASMNYQEKIEIAKKITAAMFYILDSHQNEVRLSTVNNKFRDYDKLNKSNLEDILSDIKANEKTNINKIRGDEKEVIFLISDLWQKELNLRFLQENKIHVIHLLTEDELDLSVKGNLELIDSENGNSISVIPSEIREKYKALIEERTSHLRNEMAKSGLAYGLFSTKTAYYVSLKKYFESIKSAHIRRRA